jgi:AraC family transcriptional regulator
MLMEPTPAIGGTGDISEIIFRERRWLALPGEIASPNKPGIRAGRWKGHAENQQEEHAVIETDYHVIEIALRPMNVTIFAEDRLVHNGLLRQGSMRVNEPGLSVRGIFRRDFDLLHLRIPNAMIARYGQGGCKPFGEGLSMKTIVDPLIQRLALAFIQAEELSDASCQSYADGIGLAIVARLFGKDLARRTAEGCSRVPPLAKWRLRRAIEYIDAHLGDTIGLADIAASAGLSRMHFAAQFRTATGLRPHEYLLRQRIDRAQQLLSTSQMPLAEIALDVGFKAQTHFTSVFARFVGQTPHVWRQQNRRLPPLAEGNSQLRDFTPLP